jgi:hypothetical protein
MKFILNISDISPSEIYLLHTRNFSHFQKEILGLYNDYPNKHKIVSLLDYWILNIYSLKIIYGENGLKSFISSDFDNPQRFSFLYELSNQIVSKPPPRSKTNKTIFYIFKFFVTKILIPGAALNSLYAKLLNRLSVNFIQTIPDDENSEIKNQIFKLLEEVLLENFSVSEISKINEKLPKVFYSNVVNMPHNSKITIEGSCSSFFEFFGVEKLLLLNNKLRIEGYQHGGGYDVFKIDYFVEYEKKMSDIFYGWGFSKYNKSQHRFKKQKIRKNNRTEIKRVFWVEDSSIPSSYFPLMPYYYYQTKNRGNKSFVYNELNNSGINYSNLNHPSSKSNLYDDYRKDDYHVIGKGRSEDVILSEDILIFDNVGSTLIHFAIENGNVFYLVINKNDFDLFTNKQKEFFNLLRKYDFGIFSNEKNKLSNSILSVIGTNNYILPSEIVLFYNQIFLVSPSSEN